MQFVDLAAQQARMNTSLHTRLNAVLAGNHYILGPEVEELETKLAAFTATRHCLGCSSGSTALDLVLMAWELGPGDAVLTTPFTFVATAESIAKTGATPVFVDIDPLTLNMDADRLEDALAALRDGRRVAPSPSSSCEERAAYPPGHSSRRHIRTPRRLRSYSGHGQTPWIKSSGRCRAGIWRTLA